MPDFDSVVVHGATLCLLLHTSAVARGDCDGLLYGQVRTRVHTEFQDDSEGTITIEEHHAYITSFTCCTSTCSFYDAAGQVSESALVSMTPPGRDPLLGWISIRTGAAPLLPSMRELRVTEQLAQQGKKQPGQQPRLLLLLGRQSDHAGATITLPYQVYQVTSAANGKQLQPPLVPVPLRTINLGRSLGHKAYSTFEPVIPLSRVSTDQHEGKDTSRGQKAAPAAQSSLIAAADASTAHVTAVEAYYQGLLQDLGRLCQEVSNQSGVLHGLQAQQDQLLRALQQVPQ